MLTRRVNGQLPTTPPAASTPPAPRTYTVQSSMRMPPSSPARGRVPPRSTDRKSSRAERERWRSTSRLWRSSRRYRPVALYGRCAHSSAVFPSGCEWFQNKTKNKKKETHKFSAAQAPPHSASCLFRDYYAALLRTRQSFVTPTQGKLLNYVQRVPLGVVAQITVASARPRL